MILKCGAEALLEATVVGVDTLFSNSAHTETATGLIKYPYEKVIGCDEVVGCDMRRVESRGAEWVV